MTVNSDYVILYDSTQKLDKLKQLVDELNPIIITFDNLSHDFLNKNGIKHMLSEDFCSISELEQIQNSFYTFSNWFENPILEKSLNYDGINLGELFVIEFGHYLLPNLKKIFEIKKIISKYNDSLFFSSNSLLKIVKLFYTHVEYLDDEEINIKSSEIKIPVSIWKFKFYLNPNNIFLKKINGLFYFFANLFLNSNSIVSSQPTILLVNFTTMRLQKFFKLLPYSKINLVKFDTLIPAFWNFKSFNLIKNSGCIIESNQLLNQNNYHSQSLKILDKLLDNDVTLKSFFTLENVSFWDAIKDDFVKIFLKNSDMAIKYIVQIKSLLKKYHFSNILLRSEADLLDLIIIKLAQKKNIHTSILQHGFYYDDLQNLNYDMFKGDQFQRLLPKYSDTFFVWGNLMKTHSEKHEIPSEKISISGCPFFDFENDDNNSYFSNEYILLSTTPPSSANSVKGSTIKVINEYKKTIENICKVVSKMNKKLLIKVHPHMDGGEKEIATKINPEIIVTNEGSFSNYVRSCEAVIFIDMSTAMLESMLYKKPIISIMINDINSHPYIYDNDVVIKSKISDLDKILKKLSDDKKFKQECLNKQEEFKHLYLSNINSSSKTLLDFFECNNKKKF